MSVIEDTRKLLQDVVTPDFKALGTRVDALVQRVDALEKSMKEGFAKSDVSLKEGLAKSDANLKEGLAKAGASLKEGLAKADANMNDALARSDASLKAGLASFEQKMDERFQHMQTVAALNERLAAARHDALASRVEQAFVAMRESQEALVTYLNLERRIKRIEKSASASKSSPAVAGEPAALPKSA